MGRQGVAPSDQANTGDSREHRGKHWRQQADSIARKHILGNESELLFGHSPILSPNAP